MDKDTVVNGIRATIKELSLSGNADQEGKLAFSEIAKGTYTVELRYNDINYEYQLVVPPAAGQSPSGSSDPSVLGYSIDISQLSPAKAKTASNGVTGPGKVNIGKVILITVFLLVLAAGAVFAIVFIRRRRNNYYPEPVYTPAPPVMATPPPIDPAHAPDVQPHTGVSLKDLVLESMREEASRRNNDKKP